MGLFSFGSRKREIDEFEGLVEAHLDSLYGAALRYTRNAASAEDLVQDTVMRALRFRHRFEMGTNFRAWIHTILTNTFIHRYRRQKREREILEGTTRDDVDRQLVSPMTREQAMHPEHHYLDHMLSDDVLHALDSLPDDFRQVVVMCDIEGLSYKEIAEAMDSPVGTVMSRLYRARRMLEGKLQDVARERGILKGGAPEDKVLDIRQYKRRKEG